MNYILPLFLMGVAAYLSISYFLSKENRAKQKLKKSNFVDIGFVQDNTDVKIEGKVVESDTLLIAPLSQKECVYYHLIVERHRGGKNSSWYKEIEEVEKTAFLIQGNDNRYAFINTKNCVTFLKNKYYSSIGTFNDSDVYQEAILNSHQQNSTNWFGFNKRIRFTENIIEMNTTLTIHGKANWQQKKLANNSVKDVLMISETADGFCVLEETNREIV